MTERKYSYGQYMYCIYSYLYPELNLHSMNTSIQHLPSYCQEHLAHAIRIIREIVFPEKIILYGVFASSKNLDLYSENGYPSLKGGYELLVVTRSIDFRSDHHIQDIA